MPGPVNRVPVVAGLAFIEHVERLPGAFTASLRPDPTSHYNPRAIKVQVAGQTVGYIAPEIARHYYGRVSVQAGNRESGAGSQGLEAPSQEPEAASPAPVSAIEVPGTRDRAAGHNYLGVLLTVDLSGLGPEED